MLKRMFRSSSYTLRLLSLLFAFTSILLVVFSVTLYFSYQNSGRQLMSEYNQKVIYQIIQNYNTIDETMSQLISGRCAQPDVVELFYRNNLSEFEKNVKLNTLQKEISSYPMYHSAVLYNNQSNDWSFMNISSVTAEPIVQNFYRGDRILGSQTVPTEIRRADGRNELIFTYYIYEYVTEASVINGGLAINIRTDWIRELLQNSDLQGFNFVIVDGEGRVILDSNGEIPFQTQLERSYLQKVLQGQSRNSFESYVNGKKMMVSTATLPRTGWLLVCEQPFSALFKIMEPLRLSIILLTLVLIALAFFGAAILSRYLYRPMRGLVAQANKVNADEFVGKDEFGYLMKTLQNSMEQRFLLEENKRSISEIKRQNYFKFLIEDGCLQGELEDFEECADFICSGQFFAVMLKTQKRVDAAVLGVVWREWAHGTFTQYEWIPISETETVVLIKEEDSVNVLRSSFMKEYSSLQDKLREVTQENVSLFVTTYYSYDRISEIYSQLRRLCKYELMYSVGCCLNEEVLQNNHDEACAEYPIAAANRLLGALRKKEAEKAEVFFDEFLSEILRFHVDHFRMALMRLALSIQNLYEEASVHRKNSKIYREMTNVVQKIATLNSMDDVQMYFLSLFSLMCEVEEKNTFEGKHSVLVSSIADYIMSSYSDPNLSLEQVADVFKMSPNYVGKVFKEARGCSVSTYITNVRIDASLRLLNDTGYSIKEIIEQIGFINESGFYRQFKARLGITPKEYRMNRVLTENVGKREE